MAKEKQSSHLKQELPGSLEGKRPESPPLSQPVEAKGMLAFDADWRSMNQSKFTSWNHSTAVGSLLYNWSLFLLACRMGN